MLQSTSVYHVADPDQPVTDYTIVSINKASCSAVGRNKFLNNLYNF